MSRINICNVISSKLLCICRNFPGIPVFKESVSLSLCEFIPKLFLRSVPQSSYTSVFHGNVHLHSVSHSAYHPKPEIK